MSEFQLLLVVASAFFGGAINSVAGGGTFLLFPALIFGGISPFSANILCSIGLWPATISSAFAYRREFTTLNRAFKTMLIISLVGSTIGTLILLNTSEKTFETLIPWLLLMATALFAFGKNIAFDTWKIPFWGVGAMQFCISVYGGYFGAGIGILMLAMLQLMGMKHIHAMNAVKVILATAINFSAICLFIIGGKIRWDIAVWIVPAAIAGGYVGANLALRMSPEKVRWVVIAIGAAMTVYFFAR